MSLLQELFKEVREEELYELCPNDKARHNLLRFIVSMHSPETKFSDRMHRYCDASKFVIGSGLTKQSVVYLSKGGIKMAKGKEPENLELIGGLALMLPEMAAKIAEGGSVSLTYDGENLDFGEAKPAKGKEKPGKGEDAGEDKPPKKKGKPEKEEKPKGKPKKGFKIESLEEFDEKATVDNIEDVEKWAEENSLDYEASTKAKITLKRIREAAIEEWGEDDEDWAEGE